MPHAGIAGISYPDALQVDTLIHRMMEALSSRSPHSPQFKNEGRYQFGGAPLMANEKNTCFVALDGEFDNRHALGNILLDLGVPCDPHSSVSVLLKAYETWGIHCLEHLSGPFALFIYDSAQDTLILARDRIGQKPLYWFEGHRHFLFASELKALLSTGLVPQTPAPDALAMYFYFGYIPQDLTPIKGVNKLLPGHYLIATGTKMQVLPYWSFSTHFEHETSLPSHEITHQLHHLLEDNITRNLAKGSAGCFVSGGLGSATVAHYLKEAHPDVQAFTVGFEGQNEADIGAAMQVCENLSLEQTVERITPQTLFDHLVKMIWTLDEPIADPQFLATWRLCSLASTKTRQVFSGMGSDELMAGHNRYSLAERDSGMISRVKLIPKPVIDYVLLPLSKLFNKSAAYNLLKAYRTDPSQFEFLRHNALFDEVQLASLSPKLVRYFDPETFLHKFHHLDRIKSTIGAYMYFDVKTRLPDQYILQYERFTTAFGLDWDSPFLDRTVVEFAAHLPEPESLEENETASYLKPLVASVFPPPLLNRPKKSRPNFLSSWLNIPSIHATFSQLRQSSLVETGVISKEWLESMLLHYADRRHAFQQLWSVLVLEIWFQLFINRPVHPTMPQVTLDQMIGEK